MVREIFSTFFVIPLKEESSDKASFGYFAKISPSKDLNIST